MHVKEYKLTIFLIYVLIIICVIMININRSCEIQLNSDKEYIKRMEKEINDIAEKYSAIKNEYFVAREKYEELLKSYIKMSSEIEELKRINDELAWKYSALSIKYYEDTKMGAREILKNISHLVSPSDLLSLAIDFYEMYETVVNTSSTTRLLASLNGSIAELSYKEFVYLIVEARMGEEIHVYWDVIGDNYSTMVMYLEDFISFMNNHEYKVLAISQNLSSSSMKIIVNVPSILVTVLINLSPEKLYVKNFVIKEKIIMNVPLNLKKIFVVNKYVSERIPYVPDTIDEPKQPLKTLQEGGDCEDRAILVVSLLLALGFTTSKVALGLIDTDGDLLPDHVSAMAQLVSIDYINDIANHLYKLRYLFNTDNIDHYYSLFPQLLILPSNIVTNSDGKGYFIIIDPLCSFMGVNRYSKEIIPGYIAFSNYNVIYAETIESLFS